MKAKRSRTVKALPLALERLKRLSPTVDLRKRLRRRWQLLSGI